MAIPGRMNATFLAIVENQNCLTECIMNCKISVKCAQTNFNIRSKICELLTIPLGVIEEVDQHDWWTYGKPIVKKVSMK